MAAHGAELRKQHLSCLSDFFYFWLALTVALALAMPTAFSWIEPLMIRRLLALLVFMMGTTASPADFHRCLVRPRPILVNFLICFALLPAVSLSLARLMRLPEALQVGLVLLGGVNGGSASNLFTLLAGGDVALSVLMTISTTLGAVLCTPLVAEFYLGALVPVDSVGILKSAVELVLLPIALGIAASAYLPRSTARLQPAIPTLGLGTALPLIGAVVASNAELILTTGASLHIALLLFHLLAAFAGYFLSAVTGGDERERRTVTIEVTMKNNVFACMLASAHFQEEAVQVAPAAGCIWCPMVVSALSALWSRIELDRHQRQKAMHPDSRA